MAEQKAKARAAWAGSGEAADARRFGSMFWTDKHGTTDFLGYDTENRRRLRLRPLVQGRRFDLG